MKTLISTFLFALMAAINFNANATDYYWAPASDNNFGTAGNWRLSSFSGTVSSSAPSSSDNIFIGNGTTGTSINLDNSYTITNMTIEGSGQITFNTGNSSYTLSVTGDITSLNTNTGGGGAAKIVIAGSGTQNITGNSTTVGVGRLPNVNINCSGTVNLSGYISMGSSTTLTYTAGTVSAGTSDVIFINGNTISGNITLNNVEFEGNGTAFTISNTLTLNGDLKLSGGSACILNTGTIDLNGNLNDVNTSSSSGGSATIVMDASGNQTYSFSSGFLCYLSINSGGTVSAASGTTALNVTGFNLAGGTFTAPSGSIYTVNNLSVTGGTFNASSGTITVRFAFSITGGTFNASSGTMTIGQSNGLGINGSAYLFTSTGGTFNAGTGTVNFSATGSRSYYLVNITNGISFYNVAVNISTTNYPCSLSNSNQTISVTNNLTHNIGVLGGSWELQGNLIVGSGAIAGGGVNPGTGTVTMDGSNSVTYSAPIGAATAAIVLNKSGGATVSPALGTTNLTIMGLTLQNGVFNAPTGVLTVGYGLVGGIDATYTIFSNSSGATFNNNSGTINFQPTGSRSNYIVDVGGAGVTTFYNVSVNLTVTNYTCFLYPGTGQTIVATNNLTHTLGVLEGNWEVQGNLVVESSANGGGGNITMDGSSSVTYSCAGGGTASITVNKSGGASVSAASGTTNLALQCLFLQNGTFSAPTGTLSIGIGTNGAYAGAYNIFTNNSGATFNNNGGTVNFQPTGTNSTFIVDVGSGTSTVFNNVVINLLNTNYTCYLTGASGETFYISGDLTLTKGVVLTTPLNIKGHTTVGSGFNGCSSPLTFCGTSNENFDLTGGPSDFTGNITINKTSGNVTLLSPLNIATSGQTLTFTQGNLITTSTNLLTFSNGTSCSGANDNSYVSGPVKKVGNSAFTFPVGGNNKYRPIGISAPSSTTDAFQCCYNYSTPPTGTCGTGVTDIENCEYWNIDHTSGSSSVNLNLDKSYNCFQCFPPGYGGICYGSTSGGSTTYTSCGACTNSGNNCTTTTSHSTYGDKWVTLCKTAPLIICNATSNHSTICSGSSATLTVTVSGGTSPFTYSWSPSISLNSSTVSVTPTTTTTYTVTVGDAVGECKTATVVVTVIPSPTAHCGSGGEVCQGNSVTIGANPGGTGGTSPYTYSWSPSTGLNSSTLREPTASPSSTTNYVLTVTDANGCQGTCSTTVTIDPLPANNAGTDRGICIGSGTTLGASAVSGHTYAWNPSTALSSSSVSNPSASPTTTITYTLTETITATGCSSSNSVVVTVNALPDNNAGTDQTICSGSGITIGAGATGGHTYTWNPSTGLSSSTVSNPLASPTTASTYTLTETITATGCSVANSVIVSVNPAPADNAGPDKNICLGASTTIGTSGTSDDTYSWSPATGLSSSTESNPTASPTITINYTLTETITATGCSASNAVLVTVNPLPGDNAGSDQTICNGSGVAVGVTSATGHTYNWNPSTGLSSSTVSNPVASPTASTTYTLSETITATGCSSSNTIVVTVNPVPGNNAGSGQTICSGSGITIGEVSTTGDTYSWSPSTGLSSSTLSDPIASPTTTTTYVLTETITATGCSTANSVTITVNAGPGDNAGSDQTICSGSGTVIGATATTGNTYSWSPSTGLSNSTVSNPTASPTTNTTYTLTETITATGCSASNSVVVSIDAQLYVNAGTDVSVCPGQSITIGGICSGTSIYSLSPVHDAPFVYHDNYNSANTNYGSLDSYQAVSQPGASGGVNNARSVMAFDLSAITSGTTIISATLDLYGRGAVSTAGDAASYGNIGDNRSYLQRVTSTWDESIITWNTQPTITTTDEVALPASTAIIQDYTGISVTQLVQDMINDPLNSYGFELRLLNETPTAGIFFCSREYADASKRPKLTVTVCSPTASGGTGPYHYSWSPSTGLSSSTVANPNVTPTVTTTYTLTVTDNYGCSGTATVVVTVNPVPVDNAGSDQTICEGSGAVIGGNATTGHTYSWSPSTGLSSSTVSNPTASPSTNTTYTLTETITATGCSASNTVVVQVKSVPDVQISASSNSTCLGGTVTLTSSGADSYSWNSDPSAPLIISGDGTTATAIPDASTTYSVTGTTNGCSATATVVVTVEDCCPLIENLTVNVDYIKIDQANNNIYSSQTWSGKYFISTTLNVYNDAILDLTNVDLIFGPYGGIVFHDNSFIRANNSVFRPCDVNGTWNGFSFLDYSAGIIDESLFKNAVTAIHIQSAGDIRIDNNNFSNDNIGIFIEADDAEYDEAITGNTFIINSGSPTYGGTYPFNYFAIKLYNTTVTGLISQNNFVDQYETAAPDLDNVHYGVYAELSSFTASKNTFSDMYRAFDVMNNSGVCNISDNTIEFTENFAGQHVAIWVLDCSNPSVTIERNIITDNSGYPFAFGLVVQNSEFINTVENTFNNFWRISIYYSAVNQGNILRNTIINGTIVGIELNDCEYGIAVDGNYVNMNSPGSATGIGYSIYDESNYDYTTVQITNNCVYNTYEAILLSASSDEPAIPLIQGNYLYNYTYAGLEDDYFSGNIGTSCDADYATLGLNSFISNYLPDLGSALDVLYYGSSGLSMFGNYPYPLVTSGSVYVDDECSYSSIATCQSGASGNNSAFDPEQQLEMAFPVTHSGSGYLLKNNYQETLKKVKYQYLYAVQLMNLLSHNSDFSQVNTLYNSMSNSSLFDPHQQQWLKYEYELFTRNYKSALSTISGITALNQDETDLITVEQMRLPYCESKSSVFSLLNKDTVALSGIDNRRGLYADYARNMLQLIEGYHDAIMPQVTETVHLQLENSGISSLKAFPNPTGGELKIFYSIQESNGVLELSDITGRKLREFKVTGKSSGLITDISDLTSGIYIISLKANDHLIKSVKIIKD